jgi:hypothetical protein
LRVPVTGLGRNRDERLSLKPLEALVADKAAQTRIAAALLDRHGRTYCEELEIAIGRNTPSALFRWLCAAMLFSARISAELARRAASALTEMGWTSPQRMLEAGWAERARVLKPEGRAEFRLVMLGRKRLPQVDRHERIWGFIDRVVKKGAEIEAETKERHYGTETRGERTVPAACPAGEGVYAFLQRGRNLHLTYQLELPKRPGEVQEELNIRSRVRSLFRSATRKRRRPRALDCPSAKRRTTQNRCSGNFAAGVLQPRICGCSITKAPNSS